MQKNIRRRKNRTKWIVLSVFVVLTVIGAALVLTMSQPKTPKVQDYLRVMHTESIGEYHQNETLVHITYLGFNVTAIVADAHDLMYNVDYGKLTEGQDYTRDLLGKGDTWDLGGVQLTDCYVPFNQTTNTFNMPITLGCYETGSIPEEIVLQIPKSQILVLGQG